MAKFKLFRRKKKQIDHLNNLIDMYSGIGKELADRMGAIRMITDPNVPITDVISFLERYKDRYGAL